MHGNIDHKKDKVHPCKSHGRLPPLGRFSHGLITSRKRKREHKVLRLVWEFHCLHFVQFISMSPHGIGCKQTWCKKIYRMNRATWLNPLTSLSEHRQNMARQDHISHSPLNMTAMQCGKTGQYLSQSIEYDTHVMWQCRTISVTVHWIWQPCNIAR